MCIRDRAYTSYENGEDAGISGVSVTDEKPNTDIKVIPSDANALILMDTGAQSPKGVPGQVVKIVLPLAVNKEYLPSEKYMLRNINIYPDVPTDASVSNWPCLLYTSPSADGTVSARKWSKRRKLLGNTAIGRKLLRR